MNKNLETFIKEKNYINYLIDNNIVTKDYVIDKVIESGKAELIYYAAKNIKNAPIDKLEEAMEKTNEEM